MGRPALADRVVGSMILAASLSLIHRGTSAESLQSKKVCK